MNNLRSETPTALEQSPNEKGKIRWEGWTFPCGTRRIRLYIDGKHTPYFIDKATVRAHFTQNNPVGLFGSGMGDLVATTFGKGYRIARCFGAYRKVSDAKRHALSLAVHANHDSTLPN